MRRNGRRANGSGEMFLGSSTIGAALTLRCAPSKFCGCVEGNFPTPPETVRTFANARKSAAARNSAKGKFIAGCSVKVLHLVSSFLVRALLRARFCSNQFGADSLGDPVFSFCWSCFMRKLFRPGFCFCRCLCREIWKARGSCRAIRPVSLATIQFLPQRLIQLLSTTYR